MVCSLSFRASKGLSCAVVAVSRGVCGLIPLALQRSLYTAIPCLKNRVYRNSEVWEEYPVGTALCRKSQD